MSVARGAALGGLLVALFGGGASAEPACEFGITRDWRGLRQDLCELGVELTASYLAGFWGVVHGGRQTGSRYEGFAAWGIDADLDELVPWRGAKLHLAWNAYHGQQPSEFLVGTVPNNAISGEEAADDFVRFYELYLEQELLGGALALRVGQLASDETFYTPEHATELMNASFAGLRFNTDEINAPTYPLAAPGIQLEASPSEQWRARLGVFTGAAGDDESANFGFGWEIGPGAGLFVAMEVSALRRPFDRPAVFTLGAWVDTTGQENFKGGGQKDGVYGFYASIEHALLLDAAGDSRLGFFLAGTFAPQEDRVIQRGELLAGLRFYGPLRWRPDDAFSAGLAYTRYGRDYRRSGERLTADTKILEFTYRVQVTPWFHIQPDIQLVIDPNLGRSDALVLGLRSVLSF